MRREYVRRFKCFSLALMLILCMMYSLFIPIKSLTVYAEDVPKNTAYSNVLIDLQKDKNFNVEDYPINNEDTALHLIQIAESTDRELMVYVYQPCATKSLLATSINISLESRNLNFKNYKLKLLNSNGTLYKYKVEGLEVESVLIRYYEISSIFRAWQQGVDEPGSSEITEVPFKVGKAYSFTGDGNNITMYAQDIDTIEVTSKYVGFVKYPDGFSLFQLPGGCYSHFVAFSTDKQIDKLMEADVYYSTQARTHVEGGFVQTNTTFGTQNTDNYAYLKYSDSVSYDPSGWFVKHTYTWNRIQTISDFINNVNSVDVYSCGVLNVYTTSQITEQGKQDLQDKQWVLRFAETPYSVTEHMSSPGGGISAAPMPYYETKDTITTDVTILRLKFETAGKVYNLGVIDNKMNSADAPINDTKTEFKINWKKVLFLAVIAIVLVVLLIILAPHLPKIFACIWAGIKWIFKGLWWLLTLPYRVFIDK